MEMHMLGSTIMEVKQTHQAQLHFNPSPSPAPAESPHLVVAWQRVTCAAGGGQEQRPSSSMT
jgi:hypothetical protein